MMVGLTAGQTIGKFKYLDVFNDAVYKKYLKSIAEKRINGLWNTVLFIYSTKNKFLVRMLLHSCS